MSKIMRYHSTDEGNCRVYYTTMSEGKQRLIYCLYEAERGVLKLYRCSQDGEPSHEVGSEGRIFHFPKCAARGMYFKKEACDEMDKLHALGRPATVVEITSLTELIRKHRPEGHWREIDTESIGGAQ